MENLLNYPWDYGFLLACILGLSLELGRRIRVSSKVLQHSEREEQMVAIRDGLFVLVSLLLGFSLALAAEPFVERRSLLIEESISHAVLGRRFARRTYTLITSAHNGKTSGAQYRRPGLRSSKSAST